MINYEAKGDVAFWINFPNTMEEIHALCASLKNNDFTIYSQMPGYLYNTEVSRDEYDQACIGTPIYSFSVDNEEDLVFLKLKYGSYIEELGDHH